MRRLLLVFACVGVFALVGYSQSAARQAAEEVIAVTKAQWAAEMKKDVAAAMKNVADDYTEFNDEYPTRLDGKRINMRLAEANNAAPGNFIVAEMANEKVQVYGDVAILTYNFIGAGQNKDGVVEPIRAKSTRVYVKRDGQWWLVHANFAPAR